MFGLAFVEADFMATSFKAASSLALGNLNGSALRLKTAPPKQNRRRC
jgi:hypothetical protein